MKLTDQHACVQREIAMRKRVYPRWVASGKMTKPKADHEIATMEAVLATIEAVMKRGGIE